MCQNISIHHNRFFIIQSKLKDSIIKQKRSSHSPNHPSEQIFRHTSAHKQTKGLSLHTDIHSCMLTRAMHFRADETFHVSILKHLILQHSDCVFSTLGQECRDMRTDFSSSPSVCPIEALVLCHRHLLRQFGGSQL